MDFNIIFMQMAFTPQNRDDSSKAKHNIEKCINIIKDFLLENRMKLNDGKTEFLIMRTANKLKKVHFDDNKIGEVQIKAVKDVKNLGVIYDCEGKLEQQVSNLCRNGLLLHQESSCH